ncbi:hypothetical protein [Natrinema halophilum]|uniref:hypothetical protein n=1 Tax=Natrinema halophilum TaxID=1699371 RepID=UPI001F2FC4DC|nr:hypothetical protein [Natrinema halophilum]UHQ96098.1 hypothetical protein HYG82_22480 [Natrinema halophilum]
MNQHQSQPRQSRYQRQEPLQTGQHQQEQPQQTRQHQQEQPQQTRQHQQEQPQQTRQYQQEQPQRTGRLSQPSQQGEQRGPQQAPFGQQFAQSAPEQILSAVESLDRLETVAEFADAQAMQQGNRQVAKIADAMKDIAHIQKEHIVEENPLAQEFGQCSQQVIQSGIQQLQQYQQQPEIQELVETAQQTLDSVSSGLQTQPTGGQQSSRQWRR